MGLLTPRGGLFFGLAIASFVLTVLALVVPPMAAQGSPEAAPIEQGYLLHNGAEEPVTYLLRLGDEGMVLGTGTLDGGEGVRLPSTGSAATLWVRARWVDGTDLAICRDTLGVGYVILLEPNPYRVTCAGSPGRA